MQFEIFIENSIAEDIGDYDITSMACVPLHAEGNAKLLVKDHGIIAGVKIAESIFKKIDHNLQMQINIPDGKKVKHGDIVFTVYGKAVSILQAERLVLNVMQRMSGIATKTKRYVNHLKGLKTKILDTRKTTPCNRIIEKQAVKIGGGKNHRMGLYDMILIKDNHVDFCGGIVNAIQAASKYLHDRKLDIKIEVEVRNFDELNQVLTFGGVDRIMLDNFNVENTRKAVELIDGRFETESSGGITIETIRQYAECGVDFISVGELTHNIRSLDLSLKAYF